MTLKVLVLLLVFFGVFGVTHEASAQGAPWIHVNPQHNWISAQDFPAGAPLTFKIFKSGTEVASVDRIADVNGHYFLDGSGHGQDIVAGDEVTVTDGTTPKSLLVKELTITEIDPGADAVSGTATVGETVNVHVNDPPSPSGANQSDVAELGVWSVGFTGTFDITTNTHAHAQIQDGDGDATVADKQPPIIQVDINSDNVDGREFVANATVSLTISSGPTLLFGPADFTTDGFGHFFVDRSVHGVDLVPGMTVQATQGGVTKTLDLVNLSITNVSPSNDTVTGTADPDSAIDVEVHVCNESGCANRTVNPDGTTGAWVADFSTGTDTFDVTGTTGAGANIRDADGDATQFHKGVSFVNGDLSFDHVQGHQFAPGSAVTLTIADSSGTLYGPTDIAADEFGNFFLDRGAHGVDLVPGVTIEATQGETTKTLALVPLSITAVNPSNERVTGTTDPTVTPPGTTVQVGVGNETGGDFQHVTTASDGTWTADFSGEFDITASTGSQANLNDDDGDSTQFGKGVAQIDGDLSFDHVGGHQFAPGSAVSLTISDSTGPLYGPTDVTTDEFGNFFLGRSVHGVDLVPGLTIEATQDGTTKTLVLVPLSITAVNPGNDTVTGTTDPTITPPGTTVAVGVGDESDGAGQDVLTETDGTWVADFSGSFDITASSASQAEIRDDDGDSTQVGEGVVTFEASITFDHVCWYDSFESDGSVTVEIRESPSAATALFGPESFDRAQSCVGRDHHGQNLTAGMYVSVAGDQTGATKELTLADLTFDDFDVANDIATGTGPSGEGVLVEAYTLESPPLATVHPIADGTGAWSADFGALGFDLTSDMGGHAEHFDADGDATAADIPPRASFEANLSFNSVSGCGFTGGSVGVVVKGSPTAGSDLFNDTVPLEGNCFWRDFSEEGFELQPGNYVSVTDAFHTKELTLDNLSIDVIDPAANTVSGAAPPDTTFNVDAFVEAGGDVGWQPLDATSDAGGNWTVDFDDIGADINRFTHVGANIGDTDGDQTAFDSQLEFPGDEVIHDPAQFQGMVVDHEVIDFDELDASPVNNTWVGRTAFDGAHYATSHGATFSNPNGDDLYIAPGGLFWNASNSLSVAQFPFDDNADDGNDDDLVIDLNPARIAVGLTLVDNGSQDEFIQFFDADNDLVTQSNFPHNFNEFRSFIGVVSPGQPIAKIRVVEQGFDGDDVNYDDIILADSLQAQGRVMGDLNFDNVDLEGFAPNATASLTISDADGTLFGPADVETDESGHAFIERGRHGVDLVPGLTIEASHGGLSRSVTLVPLSIAEVHPANDTVTGSAGPDAEVSVHVCNHDTETCAQRDVTADATTGAWVADFSTGTDPLNITAGSEVWASIFENDNDETRFYRGTPQLRVELGNFGTHVTAHGYAPGTTLTFEIYDAPNGNLLFSGTETVAEFGEARLHPDTHGQDLQPGMFVRVTDGVLAKEHEIRFLAIDGVDPLTERVRGQASPGDIVGVFAGNEEGDEVFLEVEAGGDGVWIADFSGQIEFKHPNIFIDAHLFDEDGDSTSSFGSVPWIDVEPETDSILAHGFPSGASITFEVYDTAGGSLLGSSTVTADQDGEARVGPSDHGQDIVVGTFVRVTDGFGTKEHEVVPLTVDVANPTTNVAAGTASPGDLVHVDIPFLIDVQKCCPDQQDTAAPDGSWSVDFTGVEDDDVPGDLFEPANVAVAGISDDDGDRTQVVRPATEEAFETAAAGQTVTTDPEADGAKFEDPVETSLTTPVAGDASIAETQGSSATADTFSFLGYEIDLTAPTATVADPLVIVFTIDESLIPDGEDASTIQIFRNETFVSACLDPSTQAADPNPCVFARQNVADGDAQITVLTTDASLWEFGVSDDATDPTVGAPSFSVNPKAISETSDITAEAADTGGSGLAGGEYFVDDDPGQGNGTPMALSGSTLSATIGTDLGPGVYLIGVRAQDRAGNWSAVSTAYLVVYDPSSGFATGGGWIVPGGPNSDPGDLLPGLDGSSKANFGFVVKYDNGASTVPGGNLEFHYNVGKFHLRSAAMEWLVVTNSNWAKFQGRALIDGSDALYPFRVDARDGDSAGTTDRFVIKVYEPGADPDTADPVYKASGNVQGGQIKIHSS